MSEPINYADWTVALGTIGLVLATVVLAWFTLLLYRATKAPSVVATIEPSAWAMIHLNLSVQNEGTAAAFDLRLSFDPPLPGRYPSEGRSPFRSISILRAGQRMVSYVAPYADFTAKQFTTTVSWARKPNGRRESISYMIDLEFLDGVVELGGDPLHQIAQQMKKIQEAWNPVARGSRRIAVDAYDTRDRLHEERRQQRTWRAMERQQGQAASPAAGDEPSEEPG